MGCGESVNVASDENIPDITPKLRGKNSSNYSCLELEPSPTGMYVRSSRSKMKLQVTKDEDFLTHHIENQICLSPYASAQKIRARQIIEHYMFSDLSHSKVGGQHTTSKLTEFALKAWFQRTFLSCIERAEKLFFGKETSFNDVRKQIAEEYVFEIYQMGQFINAGFGKFGDGKSRVEIPLSIIILSSDSTLYPLLNKLQEKYPLVQQDSGNITFPDIKPMTQNINLLTFIQSKCFSDPQHLNIQNIFDDLKFLIDQANSLFSEFQSDMLSLLGKEALVDCKVKSSLHDGKISYNASQMRRVFIKWSQTMIQRIPDICLLEEFLEFITSKKKMADHFIFKSIFSQTTHYQVIQCLTLLLESIKYNIASTEPREAFGLFLYDLLRCKTTRKNGQEIVALLDTLKSTNVTPSGKRFEVVRIKNRFKSATRDILINFRYGEYLVAQAQLCIDSPHDLVEVAKRIKFRHYLYQLQRGLFGPTFELIMQYEDFSRKDISVYLEAEGLVRARNLAQVESRIKKAGRTCPQRHQMVAIKGNIFNGEKLTAMIDQSFQTFNCDFCFELASFGKEYHYCYYCSLFYCLRCLNIYKSTDFQKLEISCDQPTLLTQLDSVEAVYAACRANKAITLIVYREGRPACRLFLDQIIYLLSTYVPHGRQTPKVYTLNIAHRRFENFVKKYQITRLPTTLILNQEEDPQVILVGSTFHDIEGLFEVEQRIKNGLPKGIKMKCGLCGEGMNSQRRIKIFQKEEKCQICMDTNKIDDLGDLVRAIICSNKDFYCQNGHMKCGYCSYLSSNERSYFRDHTGRSYLSNKLPIKPTFCQKFHLIDIVSQPASFTCSKCQMKVESITEEEVGYCSSCKLYTCSECLSAETESFQEREIKQAIKSLEIVSHLVEDYAEESWPCGCGKMFLKVYQTRKKDNIRESAFFKTIILYYQQKKWTCFVCQQETDTLKLHLACFFCSYARLMTNQLSHIQICLNCSIKSGMLGRRSIVEQTNVSPLKCKANHIIVKTKKRIKQSMFTCIACKQNMYSHTERYQCQICLFDCCLQCGPDFFVHNSITTLKKCLSKHNLEWVKRKPGLGFCKLCSGYIQGSHFRCSIGCQYLMCHSCADA